MGQELALPSGRDLLCTQWQLKSLMEAVYLSLSKALLAPSTFDLNVWLGLQRDFPKTGDIPAVDSYSLEPHHSWACFFRSAPSFSILPCCWSEGAWPHFHESDDISFSEAGARDWPKKQEVQIWIQCPKTVVAAGRIEHHCPAV